MVCQIRGVGLEPEQISPLPAPLPLASERRIDVEDRALTEGVPADIPCYLPRKHVTKIPEIDNLRGRIRVADRRAQNRRVQDVGPVTAGPIDVSEPGTIGTRVTRK